MPGRAVNYPQPVDRDSLVAILREMADLVQEGDSFEGFVEYTMPIEEKVPDGTFALLRCRYRIGNSMGQGGLRAFGRMHPPPMTGEAPPELGGGPVPDYTAPDEPPDG